MELRQLACLVAVVDHGGFTAAAEALGISQPAVSAQVRALEREVGERLLERSGRAGSRPTAAGEAALVPARAALDAVGEVRGAVAGLSGLLTGRVRLGHVGSGATTTLAAPILAFGEQHPGVEVSLAEDTSERLVEQVREGRLDLAWVGLAGEPPAGLAGRTVLEEPVVLAVAPDHPWARRTSITLAEAVRHPVLAMPHGTGARAAVEDACRRHGHTLAVALECSAPDLLAVLVRAGRGPAVLPAPLATALDLRAVPLARPSVRSRLVVVWSSGGPSSPAARAFLAQLGR